MTLPPGAYVVRWFKRPGDRIAPLDAVAEVRLPRSSGGGIVVIRGRAVGEAQRLAAGDHSMYGVPALTDGGDLSASVNGPAREQGKIDEVRFAARLSNVRDADSAPAPIPAWAVVPAPCYLASCTDAARATGGSTTEAGRVVGHTCDVWNDLHADIHAQRIRSPRRAASGVDAMSHAVPLRSAVQAASRPASAAIDLAQSTDAWNTAAAGLSVPAPHAPPAATAGPDDVGTASAAHDEEQRHADALQRWEATSRHLQLERARLVEEGARILLHAYVHPLDAWADPNLAPGALRLFRVPLTDAPVVASRFEGAAATALTVRHPTAPELDAAPRRRRSPDPVWRAQATSALRVSNTSAVREKLPEAASEAVVAAPAVSRPKRPDVSMLYQAMVGYGMWPTPEGKLLRAQGSTQTLARSRRLRTLRELRAKTHRRAVASAAAAAGTAGAALSAFPPLRRARAAPPTCRAHVLAWRRRALRQSRQLRKRVRQASPIRFSRAALSEAEGTAGPAGALAAKLTRDAERASLERDRRFGTLSTAAAAALEGPYPVCPPMLPDNQYAPTVARLGVDPVARSGARRQGITIHAKGEPGARRGRRRHVLTGGELAELRVLQRRLRAIDTELHALHLDAAATRAALLGLRGVDPDEPIPARLRDPANATDPVTLQDPPRAIADAARAVSSRTITAAAVNPSIAHRRAVHRDRRAREAARRASLEGVVPILRAVGDRHAEIPPEGPGTVVARGSDGALTLLSNESGEGLAPVRQTPLHDGQTDAVHPAALVSPDRKVPEGHHAVLPEGEWPPVVVVAAEDSARTVMPHRNTCVLPKGSEGRNRLQRVLHRAPRPRSSALRFAGEESHVPEFHGAFPAVVTPAEPQGPWELEHIQLRNGMDFRNYERFQ